MEKITMVPTWPKSCRKEQRASQEAAASFHSPTSRTLLHLWELQNKTQTNKSQHDQGSRSQQRPLWKIRLHKNPGGDFMCNLPAAFGAGGQQEHQCHATQPFHTPCFLPGLLSFVPESFSPKTQWMTTMSFLRNVWHASAVHVDGASLGRSRLSAYDGHWKPCGPLVASQPRLGNASRTLEENDTIGNA